MIDTDHQIDILAILLFSQGNKSIEFSKEVFVARNNGEWKFKKSKV